MRFCKFCGLPFGTSLTSRLKVYCSLGCRQAGSYKQQKEDVTCSSGAKRDLIYVYKVHNGCSKCSEKRPNCLDFHHLDRSKKSFNISMGPLSANVSLDDLKKEIHKCVLLCSNCHRIEEWGDGYKESDRLKGNQCPNNDT